MVIGLTGPNASGKGEAGIYLKSRGYAHHSLSDILREEAKKLGIEPLRENLIKLGNDLRRKHGPDFLARRLIGRLTKEENHTVDSIRNPAEVETLKKNGGFILVGVDAPVGVRFKRSVSRRRPGDPKTIQEFTEKEDRENKTSFENQQLKKCLDMADTVIVNNSSIEDFHRRIDAAIKQIKPYKKQDSQQDKAA